MTHTVDELMKIAYQYYPRLDASAYESPAHEYAAIVRARPETKARYTLCDSMIKDRSDWLAFVRALVSALPECSILDAPSPPDPCHRARILYVQDLPPSRTVITKEIVLCSSFLAPVYLIYEVHHYQRDIIHRMSHEPLEIFWEPSAGAAHVVAVVEREIASRFAWERISPEMALIKIPGIEVGNLMPGEATLANAFFSDQIG